MYSGIYKIQGDLDISKRFCVQKTVLQKKNLSFAGKVLMTSKIIRVISGAKRYCPILHSSFSC
jgi:hypothetical protein